MLGYVIAVAMVLSLLWATVTSTRLWICWELGLRPGRADWLIDGFAIFCYAALAAYVICTGVPQ